jgi:hypothetical protein
MWNGDWNEEQIEGENLETNEETQVLRGNILN